MSDAFPFLISIALVLLTSQASWKSRPCSLGYKPSRLRCVVVDMYLRMIPYVWLATLDLELEALVPRPHDGPSRRSSGRCHILVNARRRRPPSLIRNSVRCSTSKSHLSLQHLLVSRHLCRVDSPKRTHRGLTAMPPDMHYTVVQHSPA